MPNEGNLVSDQTRKAAWELLNLSDYLNRYWSEAHQRLLRQSRWVILAHVIIAVGAFGVLLQFMPRWVVPIGQSLLTVVSVYFLVRNHPWKVVSVKGVRDQCGRIETKARQLWLQIETNSITDEAAQARWHDLRTDLDDLTSKTDVKTQDTEQVSEASKRYLDAEFQNGEAAATLPGR